MTIPHREIPHRPRFTEKPASTSILLRLYWMLGGNVALFLSAAAIFRARPTALSWLDAIYGGVALSLIIARYADVVSFDGARADGTPATHADLRRYIARLSIIALMIWIGVHTVGWLQAS